ncbi:MAG TPA: DUF87 domain-containing protein [Nitrososphaerales archaeon]|nr:DUF87 domain-containing protein [Nitrososphaerales archaeon]
MIVIEKYFDRLSVLYNPLTEQARVGESLLIHEPGIQNGPNGVIAQIIEERPYVPMGMRDSLLIESLTPEITTSTAQPEELGAARSELRNQKTIIAKIRLSAIVDKGKSLPSSLVPWTGWSPTPSSKVTKISDSEILRFIDLKGTTKNIASIGKTTGDTPFDFNLYYLHGISTLVGGRGTGKSHLAKKFALKLVDAGRQVIIFDINDEWTAMEKGADGKESPYAKKIVRANPGESLSFDLKYLGKIVFISMLKMMNLDPSTSSVQTLMNKWDELDREKKLTFDNLKKTAESTNEKVKEALQTRFAQLENSGIIASGENNGTSIQALLEKIKEGGLLVVNLKDKPKISQYVIVQLFTSKLANILSDPRSTPLVLIVEEAQTYMSNFDIEEIVARLRHLGLHQIYITNSPQSLTPFLMSHISNWFLFNLVNQQDIEYLQRSLPLDLESASVLIRMLPPRQALVVINENYKDSTKNYPFVVKVDPIPYQTAGVTRELFEAP